MATRLERLVSLLDTGSTAIVRTTAAQQIGEIQKQQPDQLYNLLGRVIVHLRSSEWATRIAAGNAIEAIAGNVPRWEPPVPVPGEVGATSHAEDSADDWMLTFDTFDIGNVVNNGAPLLSSAGKEFDVDFGGLDPKERIALQKKELKNRLGLGSDHLKDLLDDDDVVASKTSLQNPVAKQSAQQLLKSRQMSVTEDDPSMAGLSARQRASMKRKMRMGKDKPAKVQIVEVSATKHRSSISTTGAGPSERVAVPLSIKTENDEPFAITEGSLRLSPTIEEPPNDSQVVVQKKAGSVYKYGIQESGDEWPFEGFCEQLCLDLFSPKWEIRHGAAVGLRAVLKPHGAGSGKVLGQPKDINASRHRAWLEDVSIRLLCVLALDRFGDYGSDQAVAPVRETAAQTLGVVMQWSDPSLCMRLVNEGLLKLFEVSKESSQEMGVGGGREKGWQVRHGALVGLKYWMAVRTDLLENILRSDGKAGRTPAFKALIEALQDHDDDVRAVSSSALLPICDALIAILPVEVIFDSIVKTLWNCLEELDDLTSATGSVMDLLSQLMMNPDVMENMRRDARTSLSSLIPRLYPFFRHAIVGVRQAVLRTVSTFVKISHRAADVSWITVELLRSVFQNFVIEEREDIVQDTLQLWKQLMRLMEPSAQDLAKIVLPVLSAWFSLVMTPVGSPLDLRFLYSPVATHITDGNKRNRPVHIDGFNVSPHDKAMALQDLTVVSRTDVIRGRLAGASAIGILIYTLLGSATSDTEARIKELITAYLNSSWAGHRVFCNVMLDEWSVYWEEQHAMQVDGGNAAAPSFADSLAVANTLWESMVTSLTQADAGTALLYTELVAPLQKVRSECHALLNLIGDSGPTAPPPPLPELPSHQGQRPTTPLGDTFTVQIAEYVVNQLVPHLTPTKCPAKTRISIEDRTKRVASVIESFKETMRRLDIQVTSSMSAAVVCFGRLPAKANPVIRALMSSVKEEVNKDIQVRTAHKVARYIHLAIRLNKPPAVTDKVLKNLKTSLCNDPYIPDGDEVRLQTDGILTLLEVNTSTDEGKKGAAPASTKKGAGRGARKSINPALDTSVTDVISGADAASAASETPTMKRKVESRGADAAFKGMCDLFGTRVFDMLPRLWAIVSDDLLPFSTPAPASCSLQRLADDQDFAMSTVQSLYLLERLAVHLHQDLHPKLIPLLTGVAMCLRSNRALVRHLAARCMASLCKNLTVPAMHVVVEQVIPLLGDANNAHFRQGAAECVDQIVRSMDHGILPYIIFLIIPVLARMSDPDEEVRFVSTNVFAQLVKLVPLESGVPDPEGFNEEMIKHKIEERKFIGQLVGTEKVEEMNLNVPIKAELRSYQKEGVSWLAFLNRYGLHGILCDDMGLGKTLQSICILASDHHTRVERFKQTGSPDSAHSPSLIVCPPTLTGHWYHEILTFADFMRPVIYTGTAMDRADLRRRLHTYDVVIMSYDILRNDIAELKLVHFNYCILDEGHIIKNPKTKITQAAKSVQAMHRVILSGTPIQNNVLELWSLFDFLMPGFLGTERHFNERFGKPIQASRDARSSSREQEQGALAMEALHKQVLPFLLRRMKEDVLHDLPPKIIQDYYCELSDLQKTLYEDFAKSQAKEGAEAILHDDGSEPNVKKEKKTGHVFQALQYLRKLVNHPALVVNESHPQYGKVQAHLAATKSSIRDLQHAPKIQALGQLLQDCGIGADAPSTATSSASAALTPVAAPHRALIFVQVRSMLDMIENDLLKKHMPNVSYLRMDGQTDSSTRHSLVRKFNEDASIDVLLLTTHVGGLGLTLTGADTVIFVEHDWNPMKDLQAMDRAHRIGQKRVVNVYRLITKGTLEEKIMGLQKFKLNIASSVINQENAGLKSMDTEQILDLFSLSSADENTKGKKKIEGPAGQKASAKDVLAGLGDLADQAQYDDLDMNEFLKGLK
ncbi:SNF2 family N-terminal domain-containing protein [Fimicolochytrium jonesii]|uniref:SNF2 family N-terminal domain-containing protein n=1 Tax=Fimicolochytrium jonesii TaxID=1396493 RepID=UPI0022FE898F|nr:SNF2 family N-terminal domain-containing protein [Fimicolochytrium jonesii]KAI8824493.1 SNF2 family N-terminal domain-containing protein [Fimicolochytrium jonesii]